MWRFAHKFYKKVLQNLLLASDTIFQNRTILTYLPTRSTYQYNFGALIRQTSLGFEKSS